MAQPRPLPGSGSPAPPRRRGRLLRFAPRGWRLRPPGRRTRIALLAVAVLVALVVVASLLVDEPLRRTIESRMNSRLKGYTARIERLRFHPLGFGVTLFGVTFAQNAHPDPPIMDIARLDASVEWKALLHRRLVANFRLARPRLHVDLAHLREEAKDPTPLEDKGWQAAFEAIYPLKIDLFVIADGEATYVDPGPFKPLRISDIQARAENIRNVHARERDYPSSLTLTAVVFDTGRLGIDGNADFLAEPFPGVKANVDLRDIPLDYFRPVTNRYDLTVSGGTLSAEGLIEYAPTIKVVDLRSAEVSGAKIDYVYTPKNEGVAAKTAKAATEATKEAAARPDLIVRAGRVRVTGSEVAVTNKAATPPFRVFLTDVNLAVDDVTNQRAEGVGKMHLTGRFMGSGRTEATMSFRPTPKGPDFDVVLTLEETDMTTMNPLLRQYGKFDVVEGRFSLYSEMHGKAGRVTGYVKPLFKDVKAYDPQQDRDKGFVKKLYERLVNAATKVLKNVPRKEVATKVDVEGRLDQPQTSTLQAIGNLLRNAFIEAILPGLEREARSGG
jgi:hypothetical protein